MLALGIDPGSKFTGYGLVAKEGSRLRFIAAGRISTKAGAPLSERLNQVFTGLRRVIRRYSPDMAAVEDIFFAKNVRSAVRLGHVRGVALLAAAEAGLPVSEYSPATIKMAVVGYGQADKSQVGLMVKKILGLDHDLTEDAADALAAAICHLNQTPALSRGRS
ncbi:MAG: crossover junction endodeoxyribonuclease RuvC [Thermodesulfobacteriota bacterium]|nr:crossover junction endodeoxyribonuclease RuvC [Thermodesulfobacteriota bacterium]